MRVKVVRTSEPEDDVAEPPAIQRPDGDAAPEPAVSPSGSFDDFYIDQYPGAVRLARSLTGRAGVAEEFAQDAFIATHKAWDRVSTFDRPDLWFRRVLVNRCLSGWRRLRTERRLLERLQRPDPLHDSTATPVEPEVAEQDAAVWRAVRALPRRQAQVIALRYVEGLNAREIGEVLDCSEATVRTHENRARAALATALAFVRDDPDEEPLS